VAEEQHGSVMCGHAWRWDARLLTTASDGHRPRMWLVGQDNRSLPRRGRDQQKGADVLDTTWMAEGKCREHSSATFFPSDGVGVLIAKRVCADCPVREACLEYALVHRIEHGVWGGLSERARRQIARSRRFLQETSI
jgi:WhiB family transcriptional regulator, redox-sensing transcriptional regulator